MSRSEFYLVALMVALGPSASFPTPAMAPTVGKASFEAERVFSAPDLVPAALLNGPGFVLAPKVPIMAFMERYTIGSEFGVIPVVAGGGRA